MATNNNVSGSGIPSTSSSNNTALSSTTSDVKEKDSIWYFTSEQLASSPSRRHGISTDEELAFRQKTAYLIQEMGQRLQVSQLCINTAIVYMHRFYAFHSFTHFSRNGIASASLFLAAKVEEQPRKLEHVIKASQKCLGQPPTSTSDASYLEQAQDLVFNENVLLQTLGFDVAIDHPHTHVVKTCHLVKACKDLAQTSYFLASNSLHLTSMCLQYRPTVVACFCIYLACKWSRWEIPQSTEGKHWFHYVDKSVTMDLLKQLTDEFIAIYEKSPARLKSKLNSIKALAQGASNRVVSKDKKSQAEDWKMGDMLKIYHSSIPTDSSSNGSGGGITMEQQVQQYQQQQQQEQQQQQLPPPTSASQQQRRSESHSSHHRGHHSSSSHHHSKQLLPPNEIGEHKPTIHKQPYASVNRPPRDPTQPFSAAVSTHTGSKQMQPPPPGVSSRQSSVQGRQSSSVVPQIPQIPQRPPPQVHDPNYHKPSGRSAVVPPTQMQLNPPPSVPNHKIMPKPDTGSRMLHKDPNGRPIDPNKISAKMYPIPPAQNVGVDMTRSMLQQSVAPQQRPYNTQVTNNSQVPPSSLHPPAYSNRTNSISSSKYDSQLSVQMQQQQQQQIIHQQHKTQQQQSVIESPFNPQLSQPPISHQYSRQQVEESFSKQPLPQQMQQCDQMELCSPPKYSQYATPQGFIPPAQQQQSSKPSSIFSPEWNEKPNPSTNNGGKATNYKASNRESPKKSDRNTPKKDKNRSLSSSSTAALPSIIDSNNAMGARQTQNPTPIFGIGKQQQKQDQAPVIPPTYGTGYGVVKRPSSSMEHQIKTEDELMRESKIRKLDMHPVSSPQPAATTTSVKPSFTSGTVNGIETNPDLVSSLLKESLCTENKFSSSGFMKTEPPTLIKSEYQDPMLLYGSIMTTLPDQILQNAPAAVKEEQVVSAVMKTEDYSDSVKSEKKKKKEKHKHKEKDKSKDKEERKKHKKDKDRHKDKERASETSESSEPVKIKISKDKLNLSASSESLNTGAPVTGFKIKIPKDRITGDLSSSVGGGANYDGLTAAAAPPLKIKISKDKIENYSSSNIDQQPSMNTLGSGAYQYHGNNVGSSSSSTSSKKKDRDRDRERDKEKKRSSHDYNKINGSSNLGSNGGGNPVGSSFSMGTLIARDAPTVNNSTNASVPPKGQISNKVQQYNTSNMSHLFGESNDDDDDDDDDDDSDNDIGSSPKLPSTFSSSSSSHHKTALSSHGTSSRYNNSSDNRYSSSGNNNVQQQFPNHRRQSSSSYQKSNW